MNGLAIANLAGQIISSLAPLLTQGIQNGMATDPVLTRQFLSAIDLANHAILDADARFQAMDKATDDRLDTSTTKP